MLCVEVGKGELTVLRPADGKTSARDRWHSSDAVFTYLLVRYGVHPQQLIGIEKPTRVGDVL
jgi:hypothetical protein